ncbi:MAG: SsrA-binding protein, partial [Nitrospirae bacterium]|nr:SsrA-binding protein [Nitrospirota bacterium]
MTEKKEDTTVATNRKAYHDYFIEETIEAGMA